MTAVISLAERMADYQRRTDDRIAKALERTYRVRSVQQFYEARFHVKHPGVPILWVKADLGRIRALRRTYEPQLLKCMIAYAVEHEDEIFPVGLTFGAFYNCATLLAQRVIALAQTQARLDAQRRQLGVDA